MIKPEDIPQDVWDKACLIISFGYGDPKLQSLVREDVARAILAERERFRSIVDEWHKGCSNAMDGDPEACAECTSAAMRAVRRMACE